jgi:hypothetical protein
VTLRALSAVLLLPTLGSIGCARPPSAPATVTIVADPGPFGSIAEAAEAEARVDWTDARPRDDDACTASFAAVELARFLPACLGLRPGAVRLAASLPAQGHAVVVGRVGASAVLDSLGLAPRQGAPHGFRLRGFDEGGRQVIAVAGEDRAGTLHGAYALLERLGMRFYGLGDSGTVAPVAPSPWPEALDEASAPSFAARGFWAWEPRGHRELFLWMARNRLNQWTAADTAHVPLMKKLGFRLTGGGHTIQADFLPPARYFPSHPDWYGLHEGRRSPRIAAESGDNFCTSNAAARRALAENLTRALAEGSLAQVDALQLWMLDGGRWCTCRGCRRQGTPTDRLLELAAEVAARVERSRRSGRLNRPVEISTLAYLETASPPTTARPPGRLGAGFTVVYFPYFRCYAHALADSTCTELNLRHAERYRAWAKASAASPGRLGVCEYYNVGAFKSLPLTFPAVMGSDLAWYGGSATSLSTMHAPVRAWGVWTLNHWLYARLAWDPGTAVDSLMSDFCRGYFPTTGALMREHYRHLETATGNILALQHCAGVYGGQGIPSGRLAQASLPLFPLRHLQASESHPATDDAPDLDQIEAAMLAARQALDRARQGVREPTEARRLADEEGRFAYGEAVFQLYAALIRTAERHRALDGDAARRAFAAAQQAAQRLREVRDLVQVSASHANAADGLEASGVRTTYEFFRRLYGVR